MASIRVFRYAALICLAPAVVLLAGCGNFQPLTFDWGGGSPKTPPASPASPAAATDADVPQYPPEVRAGQEDLAARVQAYADSISKQMATQDAQATPQPTPAAPTPAPAAHTRFVAGASPTPRGGHAASPTAKPVEVIQANENTTSADGTNKQSPANPNMPGEIGTPVVRIADAGPAAPPSTREQPATNTQVAPADWPNVTGATARPADADALATAVKAAEQQAARYPADFRTQLRLRMLYLTAGRQRDAAAPWPAGNAAEQQLLADWVSAAVALTSADPSDTTTPDEALAAIERVRERLAAQAALKIRTVQIVSRVDGFGVVTPFAENVFGPGQWIIAYSELDHFTSRHEKEGRWRTELSLRIEVLSADGKSFQVQEDPEVVDYSVNRRQDFFLARRLRLGNDLPAGQYVMKVAIEDKLGGKVAESLVRFQVR